jgi:NAD-dependent dihydropyrimidine dehydrogenase PreA subunit
MSAQIKHILYCRCANAEFIPPRRHEAVAAELAAVNAPVTVVDDLCRLAANGDPRLQALAAQDGLLLVACAPRAVRWLFAASGHPLPPDQGTFVNLREEDEARLARMLGDAGTDDQGPLVQTEIEDADADPWRPWFPVIDQERCTACRQCVNFCLFGVYETGEGGRVRVAQPRKCKNNCPACARMCPAVAIMFPKIDEDSPVNGSDALPGDAESNQVRVPMKELFTGDAYEKLKARQRTNRRLRKQG